MTDCPAREVPPCPWSPVPIAGSGRGSASAGPQARTVTLAVGHLSLIAGGMDSQDVDEARAVPATPPEVACLVRLALVEGHLIAARSLHRAGKTDAALRLAGDAEAGVVNCLGPALRAHGAPGLLPELGAFAWDIVNGVAPEGMTARLTDLWRAIQAVAALTPATPTMRLEAVARMIRVAADTYGKAMEDGEVVDSTSWHAASAFFFVAREQALVLAASCDRAIVPAAARVLSALEETESLFGDGSTPRDGDIGVLLAAATQVDFITARLRR